MTGATTHHAHVRFAEEDSQDAACTDIVGSVQTTGEVPSEAEQESGWLSKPVVQDLLQQEMATAIHTIFMPHLSSIESEVSMSNEQMAYGAILNLSFNCWCL